MRNSTLPSIATATAQELDRYTIEQIGIPSLVLMERAALGVTIVTNILLTRGKNAITTAVEAQSIPMPLQQRDTLVGKKILIVCGKGNNGGDGLASARQLAQQGAEVTIYLTHAREQYRAESGQQLAICKQMGIPIQEHEKEQVLSTLDSYDLIIDGILGTGFTGELQNHFVPLFAAINASKTPILAIDIPSGINGTTGEGSTTALQATVTVTFHTCKTGLLQDKGKTCAGLVMVWDIGLVEP